MGRGLLWWVGLGVAMYSSTGMAVATFEGCYRIVIEKEVGCCAYDSLPAGDKLALLEGHMESKDGAGRVEIMPSNLSGVEATFWTSLGDGPRVISRDPKGLINFKQGGCAGKK